MDRRAFLAGVALASVAARVRAADLDDLRTASREAWLYGLPLIEIARRRDLAGAAGINAFVADPPPRPGPGDVAAPEPGLVTASAWIDVGGGSAVLRIPPADGRYLTVTLLDMYSNVVAVLGSGAAGAEGGDFTIRGPARRVGVAGYTVPEPRLPVLRKVIRAREPWLWALARTQGAGEADEAVRRWLLAGLWVEAKAQGRPKPAPSVAPDAGWSDYFYAAQTLIDESPPPPWEADFFRRIARLQLGMAGGFERARFADADLGQIVAGVADARILAADPRPRAGVVGGWLWPQSEVGDYGQNFLLRARTAFDGLGAPGPDQLLSLRAAAPDGSLAFPAGAHWRLTLPAPPPADGPWTLALYEVARDGRLHPAANPIGRYALGDHTPLRRGPDGEIEIWIGREDPGGVRTANWLPAPARGAFALVLRAYLPRPELLGGRYRPPPLERLAGPPAR